MILLVTNSRDLTTDLVVRELRARGVAYARLNCDRLAEARLTFGLGSGRASSSFRDGDRTVDLADVTAAYLRRPVPGGPDVAAARPYAVREWSALLEGLYSELEGRWLNEPRLIQAAEDKLRQLRLAASLGFDVPATVVTNDPMAMNELIAAGPCVAKPLRHGVIAAAGAGEVVFTSRIGAIAEADFGDVGAAPFVVQREVGKDCDVRVTVIGRDAFATRIASQGDEAARTDWRRGDVRTMPHEPMELDPVTRGRCVALVEALGLRFGAIDLVRGLDGRDWFLEVNPNGQWGWIQARTGQPLAAAIVGALVGMSER